MSNTLLRTSYHILLAAAIFGATIGASSLWGQAAWTSSGNVLFTPSGNLVGIGSSSPQAPLHVFGFGGASASSGNNIRTLARFSDGGQVSHSAILFDTGATGATGFRGLRINKNSQDLLFSRFDSTGAGGAKDDMIVTSNGVVGIGTTAPRSAGYYYSGWLDLNAGIFIGNNSNVGGISFASTTTWTPNGGLIAWNKSNGSGEVDMINLSGGGNDGGFAFYDRDKPLMRITKPGNVGIGTISPQYPLSVNGIIQAKEVLVNTGWSDYVFDKDYRLRPLTEVAAYVAENHHLPEIPSAAEVAEKGISLGDMQSKLLAKIEELTLHMIQAEQENRELKERLARLEAKR